MNEILTLLSEAGVRDVFCRVASIGMREFYEASARDFYPEMKFIIADYLDYNDEQVAKHNGKYYRVLRTYRTGQELEIVATRASAEEVALYE